MGPDMDPVDGNTLENTTIVQSSDTDPRLIQMQNGDIQQADEDERQAPKIYHIRSYGGMVYVDSLNAYNVAMENCGNHIPQITYHRPRIIGDQVLHSQSHAAVVNAPSPRTSRTEILVPVDYVLLFSWALFVAVLCLAFFIINSPRLCGIGTPRM